MLCNNIFAQMYCPWKVLNFVWRGPLPLIFHGVCDMAFYLSPSTSISWLYHTRIAQMAGLPRHLNPPREISSWNVIPTPLNRPRKRKKRPRKRKKRTEEEITLFHSSSLSISRPSDFLSIPLLPSNFLVPRFQQFLFSCIYQARARSARARRACALRALGLLLADGTPTVGGGKTFWRRVSRIFLRKQL